MPRRPFWLVALLVGVALGCLASRTHAQTITTYDVVGAVEEAQAFDAIYQNPVGVPDWGVRSSLVLVYRATAPSGTVTINVTLNANTQPRVATGGQQSIRIQRYDRGVTYDQKQGTADQALTVSRSFTIDPTFADRPTFIVGVSGLPARCGTGGSSCSTIETFVMLIPQEAPRFTLLGGPGFPVVLGPPAPTFLQLSLFGANPLTDMSGVLIDGVSLAKIQAGTVPLNQSPGAGKWDRIPEDPLEPDDTAYPGSSTTSIEKFLGCFSGGCPAPGFRVALPPTPGLHTLTVTGGAYSTSQYQFFNGALDVLLTGSANLFAQGAFIIIAPQLQVSPLQAEPGATITVSGTGFAPSTNVPVRMRVNCCGSLVSLGTAHVGENGSFSEQFILPAGNLPPFSSVWPSTLPPGTPAPGYVEADVGDATFIAQYGTRGGPYSATITFLQPGTGPSTTTTTLPSQACTGDPGCDDGDPCTQDTCSGGACVHTPLTGAASIACSLPSTDELAPPGCPLPEKTENQADRATTFLGRALNKTGKAVKRLIKKADKALKKAGRAVEAANLAGALSDECADGITDVIDGVRARIDDVL